MLLDADINDLLKTEDNNDNNNDFIEVNLGENNNWKFKDSQELSSNLKQVFTAVGEEVKSLKAQLAQAQELLNRQNTNTSQNIITTDDDIPKFNQDTWVAKMKENPLEGLNYANQFTEVGTLKKELESTRQEAIRARQELEADKFRRNNPEFPGGQAGEMLDRVRQHLNLPFTQQGLEAAYAYAVTKNAMPNYKFLAQQFMEQQNLQNQNNQNQNNEFNNPPANIPQNNNVNNNRMDGRSWNGGFNFNANNMVIPTPPRNSGSSNKIEVSDEQLEGMSKEQLEALINRLSRR